MPAVAARVIVVEGSKAPPASVEEREQAFVLAGQQAFEAIDQRADDEEPPTRTRDFAFPSWGEDICSIRRREDFVPAFFTIPWDWWLEMCAVRVTDDLPAVGLVLLGLDGDPRPQVEVIGARPGCGPDGHEDGVGPVPDRIQQDQRRRPMPISPRRPHRERLNITRTIKHNEQAGGPRHRQELSIY